MKGYIDGKDFLNCGIQLYWSFPSSYKGDKKQEIKNLIFSNDYLGSRKKDGYFIRFLKDEDGNSFLLSRTKGVNGSYGEKIGKVLHLHPFFEKLPNGTCLIGEAYLKNASGSKHITSVLGCLDQKANERQKKEKIVLYFFDISAANGKNLMNEPFQDRVELLKKFSIDYENEPYIEFAKYFRGEELWCELMKAFDDGEEGIVITHQNCPMFEKRTPARKTIKVKRELDETIDCFFGENYRPPTRVYTGKFLSDHNTWINVMTEERLEGQLYENYINGEPIEPTTKGFHNKWIGSAEICVMNGDKIVPIGFLSNLSEEILSNYKDYVGKCIEVQAMEIDWSNSEKPSLRHGKMIGFRDLNPSDCTMDKLVG